MVQAYISKFKRDQEERITLAYLGAYWNRVKRMPSLKEVLKGIFSREAEKPQQTPEMMLQEIIRLNATLGGDTF